MIRRPPAGTRKPDFRCEIVDCGETGRPRAVSAIANSCRRRGVARGAISGCRAMSRTHGSVAPAPASMQRNISWTPFTSSASPGPSAPASPTGSSGAFCSGTWRRRAAPTLTATRDSPVWATAASSPPPGRCRQRRGRSHLCGACRTMPDSRAAPRHIGRTHVLGKRRGAAARWGDSVCQAPTALRPLPGMAAP